MNLLDVTGGGKYWVNLSRVNCIRVEDFGERAEIRFSYSGGEEDIFGISSARLAVLLDTLLEARVV